MQILQSKLPIHLQDRWTRKAYQMRKEHKREVSLHDFLKRLREETEIISHPLYSREAMNEMTKTTKTRNFGISIGNKDECSCCGKK